MTVRKVQPMVRAYVTPTGNPERDRWESTPWVAGTRQAEQRPSPWTLVFDTETTTDLSQRLRLVTFHIYKGTRLHRRGIAIGRRLPAADRAAVQDYCQRRGVGLLTLDEFLDVFFQVGVDRRGTIVGFNLPFDLSRLARKHAVSKPRQRQKKMRNGFTFTLSRWANRPPVQVKRISPRAAFIQFTAPAGRLPEHRNRERGGTASGVFRGFFVDVATLAGALLGTKGSLGALAELLGVTAKQRIDENTLGGPVSEQLLDYAMRDVQVTWACYQALRDRYAQLGLSTPVHRILSEASIAKAHLHDLHIRPWQRVQPDAPVWLIATALETYYGGRTETRIRKVLTPGVLVDVLSEYPTVFVMQGLSRYLIADGVEWEEEDPTDTVEWLRDVTVDTLLNPRTWAHLTRLVQLQPGPHDLLPTRADYAGDGVCNVAVAHRPGTNPAQWYTLADAAASVLATGHIPAVQRTLTFTPRDPQPDLQALAVAGQRTLDPYADDLVATLVELRDDLKTSPDPALKAAAAAVKATVNSVAYGIPIEINTTPEPKQAHVAVHLPDGGSYECQVPRLEEPGQFFHPLLATWVAGAGRLLLALIMRMVADLDGSYVFCDTDSLFIAATEHGGLHPCPGGTLTDEQGRDAIRLLTWQQVADITERLAALNAYRGRLAGRSILKVEADNFDPGSGRQRPIYAYAVASKRYALLTLTDDGRPEIVNDHGIARRSEHGLGHLLPPAGLSPTLFHDQWWTYGLHQALGIDQPEPDWFDRPMLGRLAITNPTDDRAFAPYNEHRRYDDHVRPWTFGCTATPTAPEQARTDATLLVAPYTRDPRKQARSVWTDRRAPARQYRIRTGNDAYVLDGAITVTRLRDYFIAYFQHPEAKAHNADGSICAPETTGLLQAPAVESPGPLGRIGKETNRLTTDTDQADLDEVGLVYAERKCQGCDAIVSGRRNWCSEACRKRRCRSNG